MHTLGIGKTQEEIVAGAMATGTPEDGTLLATQVVRPGEHLRASGDTIANMIDIWLALRQNERMMVITAAQPHALAEQPVRDIKAQRLRIELDHRFKTHGAQREMLQRIGMQARTLALAACWRQTQRVIRGNGDFDAIAFGIVEPKRITHLRV